MLSSIVQCSNHYTLRTHDEEHAFTSKSQLMNILVFRIGPQNISSLHHCRTIMTSKLNVTRIFISA